MYKSLIIFITLLAAVSCSIPYRSDSSNGTMNTDEPLVYAPPLDTMPSSMLDTLLWVPLENSDINVFRDITKLSVTHGRVIVGDKRQGCIHAYDFPSGKFLYAIDKKGNGPDEYLETAAFTVTPTSIYVLDNFSHAISRYSIEDGSFMEKKPISFVAWDMEAYDDESFLFTWLNNNPDAIRPQDTPNYAVWMTDGEFSITETYLPVEKDYTEIYGKSRYFTRHGKEIIFHALKYDGYFRFAKNEQPSFYPIEFSNPIPRDKVVRLKDLENTSWQYLGETPFIADDFAVFDIIEGDNGQQMFADSKQIFGNSTNWARNVPVSIVDVTGHNLFVGYINDNYEQYRQLTEYGFQRGTEAVDSLLKQGGCCLMIYSLKMNPT